ncbi:hypothetical protein [Flavobacterium psychrotrophum]|uniref:hypothetical protein n=1 Tax=Flavobacterium psychrotrophum TaxID=2294119 RepID=UPI000E31A21A|nr:hypothetical protein [Flavobacterium psychrotrophum]
MISVQSQFAKACHCKRSLSAGGGRRSGVWQSLVNDLPSAEIKEWFFHSERSLPAGKGRRSGVEESRYKIEISPTVEMKNHI